MKLTTTIKNLILRLLAENRRNRIFARAAAAMAAVVVFITTYTLVLPAITAKKEDVEIPLTLVCAVAHEHDDSCYIEQTEVFGASVLPHDGDRLDYPHRLVKVAESQLGAGQAANEDIYTAWYKAHAPRDEEVAPENGSAIFAAWCLEQAGVDTTYMPTDSEPARMLELLEFEGLIYNKEENDPQTGDLVFHRNEDGQADTVGIVTGMDEEVLYYVGPQLDGTVKRAAMALSNDLAFASLNAPDFVLPEEPEEETEDELQAGKWETELSGLPVMGHAEFLDEAPAGIALLAETGAPDGLDVAPYVQNPLMDVAIRWSTDGKNWKPMSDVPQGGIPGNALLNVTVLYRGVDPKDLKDNNYTIYMKRPDGLIDLNAHGTILVADNDRGVIRAIDDYVMLEFDTFWVDGLIAGSSEGNSNSIKGDFSFQAALDLSKIAEGSGLNLNLFGVNINVPAEDDAVAKYGDVDVAKSKGDKLIHDEATGKYYLEYTLTATAGKYGMPDVKVTDSFTRNAGYVEKYVGVTNAAVAATYDSTADGPVERSDVAFPNKGTVKLEGTSMVWQIGNMGPNEVRTLTYRVELKDNYVGIPHPDSNHSLMNSAAITARDLPHGTATTTFNPTAKGDMHKAAGAPYQKDDGLWYCDFTVRFTADRDNEYPMTNVKIYDHTGRGENDDFRQFLDYDVDSVTIYRDAALTQKVSEDEMASYHTAGNPVYQGSTGAGVKSVTTYIGTINPGESRWITYTMSLDLDKAQQVAQGDVGFFNRAEAWSDDTKSGPQINAYNTNTTLFDKTWNRKLGGAQDPEAKVISIPSGSVGFDATGDTSGARLPSASLPSNFTVPAGSYRYTVVVNESGDWNVGGSTLGDRLPGSGGTYLNFIEYMRVDVYNQVDGSGGEEAVRARLEEQTPKQTIWVKVDKQTGFAFTGEQLGLPGDYTDKEGNPLTGNEAYVMTYYANVPTTSPSGWGAAVVGNQFSMTGNVIGPGGKVIYLNGVSTNLSVTVKEPGVGEPSKKSWYYDSNDNSFAVYNMNHGALYWVITMDGSKVVNGTRIQDSTNYSSFNNYIRKESVVGFYTANLGKDENGVDIRLEDKYESLAEFLNDFDNQNPVNENGGTITRVPEEVYDTTWSGNGGTVNVPWYVTADFGHSTNSADNVYGEAWDFTIIFNREYVFNGGEKLYLIMRTEPGQMPAEGEVTSYANKVNFKPSANKGWESDKTRDYQDIYGPTGSLDKEFGGLYKVENSGTPAGSSRYTSAAVDSYSKKVVFREYTGEDGDPWSKLPGVTANEEESAEAVLNTNRLVIADSYSELAAIANNNDDAAKARYSPDGVSRDDRFLNFRYQDGAYVCWDLIVNSSGQMRGAYLIKDALPDGLELAYVRGTMVGDTTFEENHPGIELPNSDYLSATGENKQLEEEGYYHQVCLSNYHQVSDAEDVVTDYYVKGNEIAIYLPKVMRELPTLFQVVTRVTDPDVYYTDVNLANTATLYDDRGRVVEADSATTTVKLGGLSKQMLATMKEGALTSSRLPYTIVLNETAGDMDSSGNTVSVPLIDHMSPNLNVSMDTLRIYVDSEEPGNLIYSAAQYANKQAVNGAGQPLFWNPAVVGTPTVTEEGKIKPGQSVTAEENYSPVVYRTATGGAALHPDLDRSMLESDIKNTSGYDFYNMFSSPMGGKVTVKFKNTALEDLDSGTYRLVNDRAGVALTNLTRRSNRDVLALHGLGSRAPEDGMDFKLTKLTNGNWYIQNPENNKYLTAGNESASWDTNPHELTIDTFQWNNGTYVQIREGNYSMNNLGGAGNKLVGGYSGSRDGGNIFYFFKKITTEEVGTSKQLFWDEEAVKALFAAGQNPYTTTDTGYPVILTNADIRMPGIAGQAAIPGVELDGIAVGNVENVIQKRDAVGNLLYLDAEGNETTTPTGTPVMTTTTIKVAVEKYLDVNGNPDGSQMMKFSNLPDNHRIIITYEVTAALKGGGSGNSFSNEAYWEGYNPPEDGNDHWDDIEFAAVANASSIKHGAVKITKHNGADESDRLAGAQFQLFRAEYVEHSGHKAGDVEHTLVWGFRDTQHNRYEEHDAAPEIADKFWPAVYVGEGDAEREITVMRDYTNGNLLAYRTAAGTWEPITSTETAEKTVVTTPAGIHHKFQVDENGHIMLHDDTTKDPDAILDWGETDEHGRISYGLLDEKEQGYVIVMKDGVPTRVPQEESPYSEDRLHFNKVYALVEVKAPEGYDVDSTPHFFVIPKKDITLSNGDYFYHEDWPENVHICSRFEGDTPTYFLSVFDYKGSAQVGKTFGGNKAANVPGNYSFGIWESKDVTVKDGVALAPAVEKMFKSVSLSYAASDFGNYSPSEATAEGWFEYTEAANGWEKQWVNAATGLPEGAATTVTSVPADMDNYILPGHEKKATFTDLTFGEDYFIFELSDDGTPLITGQTGKVNGTDFTVMYPYGNLVTPDKNEQGVPIVPTVTVSNDQYGVSLTKQFADLGGRPLEKGVTGSYRFGIQRYNPETKTYGRVMNVQTLTWVESDTEASKTIDFMGLEPGVQYRLVEVDASGNAIEDGAAAMLNGVEFSVRYANNEITLHPGSSEDTPAVVTNQATVALPHSGGMGTTLFTLGGLLLMAAALVCGGWLRRGKEDE